MVRIFTSLVIVVLFMPAMANAAQCGVFRVVKGKVEFQKKGKSKFKKARINKKICAGDKVRTGKNGRAKIVMAGNNEINFTPEAEVLIEKYESEGKNKKVLLNVIYGKIRSNVKQKYDGDKSYYRVKTKSAVAGVRGTQFLSSFNPKTNAFKVVTFEGVVAVGQLKAGKIENPVYVNPGFSTVKIDRKPPAIPQKINPREFKQVDIDSTVSGVDVKAPASLDPSGVPSESDKKDPNTGADANDPGKPNSDGINRDIASDDLDLPPPSEIAGGGPGNLLPQPPKIPLNVDPSLNVSPINCPTCNDPTVGGKARVRVCFNGPSGTTCP